MSKIIADVVLAQGEPMPEADIWIVIDILRATSVISRWFELGGKAIYPVIEPEDALALAAQLKAQGERPLLMGERHAVLINGFDLGNSPLDLTPELINKYSCAVMSTTNGTAALNAAFKTNKPVIAACARNADAAVKYSLDKLNNNNEFKIGILCSGRRKRPAWDDTLCAGLLLEILKDICGNNLAMADCARLAFELWQNHKHEFLDSVMTAEHAKFLDGLGFGRDIKFACQVGVSDAVPVLYYNESLDSIYLLN